VVHPPTRNTLAIVPPQLNEFEVTPKEPELIDICKEEKAQGRKVQAYTVNTGTRDTTARLAEPGSSVGLNLWLLGGR
ncbi:hypothetical protein ACPTJ9_32805, partial [Pseudomonas aeruginosa]